MKESQKMGMITKIWGPAAWLFLHSISFNYSPDKARYYKNFFISLAHVLPCRKCRENYYYIITKSNLKITDKIFKSRRTFAYWLFQVHNKVQKDIYEKSGLLCEKPMYEDNMNDFKIISTLYEQFRSKCTKKAYGCVKPNKGIKLRSQIIVKPFNSKCANQNKGIILKHVV